MAHARHEGGDLGDDKAGKSTAGSAVDVSAALLAAAQSDQQPKRECGQCGEEGSPYNPNQGRDRTARVSDQDDKNGRKEPDTAGPNKPERKEHDRSALVRNKNEKERKDPDTAGPHDPDAERREEAEKAASGPSNLDKALAEYQKRARNGQVTQIDLKGDKPKNS